MKPFFKNKFQKKSVESDNIEEISLDEAEDTTISLSLIPGNLWTRLKQNSRHYRKFYLLAVGIVILLAVGYLCYFYFHTCTEYVTLSRNEREEISGTQYLEFGSGLVKYSSDGVSSVSSNGDVLWNSTFSMQSPMVDVCGSALAVAEQKGTQVYVYNEEGLLGQFQTALPIEKIRVASQGVVSVVLQDEEVAWVNFYDANGTLIAENRNTIDDFGYPLDIALSPDGLKLMVSYLCVNKGIMNTKIRFYNFDSVGQAKLNNMVTNQTYENTVAPKVIFANTETSVAFRSNGFSIFEGKQIPELRKEEEFTEEILTVFYDQNNFGLVFASDNADYKYRMQLYDMSGEKVVEKCFDMDYKEIKLAEGNVVLYNESALEVYGVNGRLKFQGTYPKPIKDIISVKGFRKYLVLTQESADMIRLK